MFLQAVAFLAKGLNLLLTFEELSLVVVFLASCHAHLVLDIAELVALLLQLLLRSH